MFMIGGGWPRLTFARGGADIQVRRPGAKIFIYKENFNRVL